MTSSQFRPKLMTAREAKMGTTVANKNQVNSYCLIQQMITLCVALPRLQRLEEVSFVFLHSLPLSNRADNKAMALTVPVEGVWFWPWHQPTPQRGAADFRSSSYWGSHRETGSDREPVETAGHSLSPGLTPLWSGWKEGEKKKRGQTVRFLAVSMS